MIAICLVAPILPHLFPDLYQVHQLVRAEFRDLVTMGRSECIRIVCYDELREEDHKRRVKHRVKENIAKQTGFRWILEAMAADGDLHQADPRCFGRHTSNYIMAEVSNSQERFDRAHDRLHKQKPVLVGHNMFTDLVYFYRTFVGQLPDTLEEFCAELHRLFPRIVDTKFLATHAEGDLNASPNLQEVAEKLVEQPLPDIVTHSAHPKYHDEEKFHEAGFDSLLTATILLRLAAKLDAERQSPKSDSDSDESFKFTASSLGTDDTPHTKESKQPHQELIAVKEPKSSGVAKSKSKTKAQQNSTPAPLAPSTRFNTRNPFEQLSLNDQDPSSSDAEDEDALGTTTLSWQDSVELPDSSNWVPIETRQREPMEMIPAWDADFWSEFGNTLRVYGTQEGVIKIAEWK